VLHELRGAGRAQFDIHSPANTVKEALMFSADLRLEGVDAQQRKTFVNEVRPHLKAESLISTWMCCQQQHSVFYANPVLQHTTRGHKFEAA
jgi:hypothetical protein